MGTEATHARSESADEFQNEAEVVRGHRNDHGQRPKSQGQGIVTRRGDLPLVHERLEQGDVQDVPRHVHHHGVGEHLFNKAQCKAETVTETGRW